MRIPPFRSHLFLITYLLTFTTYGTHLPGAPGGSFDRRHGPLPPSPALVRYSHEAMTSPICMLDPSERDAVLQIMQEVCCYRGWGLKAAHVRSTHVHAVVESHDAPNRIAGDFKAYTSQHLNTHFGDRKRWAGGGNWVRLTTDNSIREAIRYVVHRQGNPMSVFAA